MENTDNSPTIVPTGAGIAKRGRGRPKGSRNRATIHGPVPDCILVHYNGRLKEHNDGLIKYEGGNRAFIYLRDRNAPFDYIDICRAIMGRLAKPSVHGLMCSGTVMDEWPDYCSSISIRPIQTSEDVSRILGKHIAVYYQDELVEQEMVEGNLIEKYKIHPDIHELWKPPCTAVFEAMWETALDREREELAAVRAGVCRPWYVSQSEEPVSYNLRCVHSRDRGYGEIDFKYDL